MPDAPTPPEKSIALVGSMGAGKSTIGRGLATRLGLPFADSDAEIEAAAGLGIAGIFERFGEAHFRESERRAIARLVEGRPQVIATGGGAFIHAETRALLLARCTVIWLDGDSETLAERAGRRGGRPLLEGKDKVAVIERLAALRNPAYAEAHLKIRSDETALEAIVTALAAR